MRVLKFGGTSVGSVESLNNLKRIVSSREGSVVVVVSAMSGTTDALLKTSALAEKGDSSWENEFNSIRERHFKMVRELFPQGVEPLMTSVSALTDELRSLLESVYTLEVLPEKTRMEIVSFGERLSSRIVCALLDKSELYDSLDFVKTFEDAGNGRRIAVVPGHAGNLIKGRGDYAASVIAAALNAEELEIWTDVDGFMTADPAIINTSYVIDKLSFVEAMELCNFGVKVIYPPALYPVYPKDIPVHIRNIFKPDAPGTVIGRCGQSADRAVKGISSIDDTCILTVSGVSMAGIVGVDSRIFNALAEHNISVFFVSQSSSETHISLGVKAADADSAREILEKEFESEIAEGSMDKVQLMRDLSTVAIVGDGMMGNASIAGKLFSVLGRNGIEIVASTQGTEARNISFVVDRKFLRKSLNVIHDSFFLSEYQELNMFICGVGTVGGSLLEQLAQQHDKLMKENNLKINVVGIARSNKGVFDRNGIDLNNYKQLLADSKPLDLEGLKNEVIGMNIFNSVFVDCTASGQVAELYRDFFEHGVSVVAANKIAASSEYSNYYELKELARRRGVKFLFETNVGAGLPIINTINALRNSGDRVLKIEAVLSGTLNFIFNTISADIPFSRTVKMAQEQGFSEPDPRIDLSGKDVIRKLVILAREAGYQVEQSDVQASLFIPEEFFKCSMDEFWEKLPSLDAEFEARRRELEKKNRHWRFVARMTDGKYSVGLEDFPENHSFYILEGSNNIILLTTERYNRHPMLIQGYGAGAEVTAAGVFADIMSIANI